MTARPASSPSAPSAQPKRGTWRKKTPVEIVLAQADGLRKQIEERERELKHLRRQLDQFEQARKIFETS